MFWDAIAPPLGGATFVPIRLDRLLSLLFPSREKTLSSPTPQPRFVARVLLRSPRVLNVSGSPSGVEPRSHSSIAPDPLSRCHVAVQRLESGRERRRTVASR
jgi:hypothetical protein